MRWVFCTASETVKVGAEIEKKRRVARRQIQIHEQRASDPATSVTARFCETRS
jgi:hypothetical protein